MVHPRVLIIHLVSACIHCIRLTLATTRICVISMRLMIEFTLITRTVFPANVVHNPPISAATSVARASIAISSVTVTQQVHSIAWKVSLVPLFQASYTKVNVGKLKFSETLKRCSRRVLDPTFGSSDKSLSSIASFNNMLFLVKTKE